MATGLLFDEQAVFAAYGFSPNDSHIEPVEDHPGYFLVRGSQRQLLLRNESAFQPSVEAARLAIEHRGALARHLERPLQANEMSLQLLHLNVDGQYATDANLGTASAVFSAVEVDEDFVAHLARSVPARLRLVEQAQMSADVARAMQPISADELAATSPVIFQELRDRGMVYVNSLGLTADVTEAFSANAGQDYVFSLGLVGPQQAFGEDAPRIVDLSSLRVLPRALAEQITEAELEVGLEERLLHEGAPEVLIDRALEQVRRTLSTPPSQRLSREDRQRALQESEAALEARREQALARTAERVEKERVSRRKVPTRASQHPKPAPSEAPVEQADSAPGVELARDELRIATRRPVGEVVVEPIDPVAIEAEKVARLAATERMAEQREALLARMAQLSQTAERITRAPKFPGQPGTPRTIKNNLLAPASEFAPWFLKETQFDRAARFTALSELETQLEKTFEGAARQSIWAMDRMRTWGLHGDRRTSELAQRALYIHSAATTAAWEVAEIALQVHRWATTPGLNHWEGMSKASAFMPGPIIRRVLQDAFGVTDLPPLTSRTPKGRFDKALAAFIATPPTALQSTESRTTVLGDSGRELLGRVLRPIHPNDLAPGWELFPQVFVDRFKKEADLAGVQQRLFSQALRPIRMDERRLEGTGLVEALEATQKLRMEVAKVLVGAYAIAETDASMLRGIHLRGSAPDVQAESSLLSTGLRGAAFDAAVLSTEHTEALAVLATAAAQPDVVTNSDEVAGALEVVLTAFHSALNSRGLVPQHAASVASMLSAVTPMSRIEDPHGVTSLGREMRLARWIGADPLSPTPDFFWAPTPLMAEDRMQRIVLDTEGQRDGGLVFASDIGVGDVVEVPAGALKFGVDRDLLPDLLGEPDRRSNVVQLARVTQIQALLTSGNWSPSITEVDLATPPWRRTHTQFVLESVEFGKSILDCTLVFASRNGAETTTRYRLRELVGAQRARHIARVDPDFDYEPNEVSQQDLAAAALSAYLGAGGVGERLVAVRDGDAVRLGTLERGDDGKVKVLVRDVQSALDSRNTGFADVLSPPVEVQVRDAVDVVGQLTLPGGELVDLGSVLRLEGRDGERLQARILLEAAKLEPGSGNALVFLASRRVGSKVAPAENHKTWVVSLDADLTWQLQEVRNFDGQLQAVGSSSGPDLQLLLLPAVRKRLTLPVGSALITDSGQIEASSEVQIRHRSSIEFAAMVTQRTDTHVLVSEPLGEDFYERKFVRAQKLANGRFHVEIFESSDGKTGKLIDLHRAMESASLQQLFTDLDLKRVEQVRIERSTEGADDTVFSIIPKGERARNSGAIRASSGELQLQLLLRPLPPGAETDPNSHFSDVVRAMPRSDGGIDLVPYVAGELVSSPATDPGLIESITSAEFDNRIGTKLFPVTGRVTFAPDGSFAHRDTRGVGADSRFAALLKTLPPAQRIWRVPSAKTAVDPTLLVLRAVDPTTRRIYDFEVTSDGSFEPIGVRRLKLADLRSSLRSQFLGQAPEEYKQAIGENWGIAFRHSLFDTGASQQPVRQQFFALVPASEGASAWLSDEVSIAVVRNDQVTVVTTNGGELSSVSKRSLGGYEKMDDVKHEINLAALIQEQFGQDIPDSEVLLGLAVDAARSVMLSKALDASEVPGLQTIDGTSAQIVSVDGPQVVVQAGATQSTVPIGELRDVVFTAQPEPEPKLDTATAADASTADLSSVDDGSAAVPASAEARPNRPKGPKRDALEWRVLRRQLNGGPLDRDAGPNSVAIDNEFLDSHPMQYSNVIRFINEQEPLRLPPSLVDDFADASRRAPYDNRIRYLMSLGGQTWLSAVGLMVHLQDAAAQRSDAVDAIWYGHAQFVVQRVFAASGQSSTNAKVVALLLQSALAIGDRDGGIDDAQARPIITALLEKQYEAALQMVVDAVESGALDLDRCPPPLFEYLDAKDRYENEIASAENATPEPGLDPGDDVPGADPGEEPPLPGVNPGGNKPGPLITGPGSGGAAPAPERDEAGSSSSPESRDRHTGSSATTRPPTPRAMAIAKAQESVQGHRRTAALADVVGVVDSVSPELLSAPELRNMSDPAAFATAVCNSDERAQVVAALAGAVGNMDLDALNPGDSSAVLAVLATGDRFDPPTKLIGAASSTGEVPTDCETLLSEVLQRRKTELTQQNAALQGRSKAILEVAVGNGRLPRVADVVTREDVLALATTWVPSVSTSDGAQGNPDTERGPRNPVVAQSLALWELSERHKQLLELSERLKERCHAEADQAEAKRIAADIAALQVQPPDANEPVVEALSPQTRERLPCLAPAIAPQPQLALSGADRGGRDF